MSNPSRPICVCNAPLHGCRADFSNPVLVLALGTDEVLAKRPFIWLQDHAGALIEAGLAQVVKRLSPLAFWLDAHRLSAAGELEKLIALRLETRVVQLNNFLVGKRQLLVHRREFFKLAEELRLHGENCSIRVRDRFVHFGLGLGELRIIARLDGTSEQLCRYLHALEQSAHLGNIHRPDSKGNLKSKAT